MPAVNRQIVMARHPEGWVRESDFALIETARPAPGPGQILVRNVYLSLDPYMRGVMDPGRSYLAKVAPGGVMVGGTVGEIVESDQPKFPVGAYVTGLLGWREFSLSDGHGLWRVDPKRAPLSTALGILGMPGVTAHIGLIDIGKPSPGETVVISAAAGAVGATVGQIAKLKGCRAVGIAGGPAKCDYAVGELGFDACIDYKSADWADRLRAATPERIDIYFENVGGKILDEVLKRLNANARIPLCGMISQYNLTRPEGIHNLTSLIVNRARMQGFIVSDHLDRWPAALAELGGWLAAGKLKYKEDIAEGLENAPKAFIAMPSGKNFGKQLVRLGPDKLQQPVNRNAKS